GAALRSHLRMLRDELLERDPQVRRDEADAVHQMRVATRQLRSALATFRSLQEGEHAEPVRIELGWLGGLLGVARDAEVARARLAELVAAEPAELVLGPVGQRLDADRARAYRAAHQRVLKALDSARYFRLLDGLDALVDAPLLTRAAIAPAADVLPNRVHRDFKRLARAVDAARSSPPGPRRDKRLHEARKAAKRTRYAAEAVIPTIGRPAERFAYAAKALQTLLGDHHDSVELRVVLRRVGAAAHRDGEDTFTYGRLHALEQAHAERIEDQLPKLWKQLSANRLRAWMR
ncbi:MAG TPA: CHAD domain-containing protein, partial [Pengzhenrongella sp.]